ncbi:unnamed protein product, partial [Symbiodinium microadriaticum]
MAQPRFRRATQASQSRRFLGARSAEDDIQAILDECDRVERNWDALDRGKLQNGASRGRNGTEKFPRPKAPQGKPPIPDMLSWALARQKAMEQEEEQKQHEFLSAESATLADALHEAQQALADAKLRLRVKEVNIQGQSGKFTIVPKGSSGNSVGIRVTMDALREVDAAGEAVGQTGSVKHSVNTFAAQDFTVGSVEQVTLGSVGAAKISFESTVSSIGSLGVDTYLIADSGALVGDAIELDITVQSMGGGSATKKKGSNKTVSLGGSAELQLSTQVQTDCTWVEMAPDYPMVTTQGSSTTITFRFPRFSSSSLYDPVISGSWGELGLDCSGDSTGGSTTGASSVSASATAGAGAAVAAAEREKIRAQLDEALPSRRRISKDTAEPSTARTTAPDHADSAGESAAEASPPLQPRPPPGRPEMERPAPHLSPLRPEHACQRAQQWKVVGGVGKGGIIVRSSHDLQSEQLPERLATGSLVEQEELVGDRL